MGAMDPEEEIQMSLACWLGSHPEATGSGLSSKGPWLRFTCKEARAQLGLGGLTWSLNLLSSSCGDCLTERTVGVLGPDNIHPVTFPVVEVRTPSDPNVARFLQMLLFPSENAAILRSTSRDGASTSTYPPPQFPIARVQTGNKRTTEEILEEASLILGPSVVQLMEHLKALADLRDVFDSIYGFGMQFCAHREKLLSAGDIFLLENVKGVDGVLDCNLGRVYPFPEGRRMEAEVTIASAACDAARDAFGEVARTLAAVLAEAYESSPKEYVTDHDSDSLHIRTRGGYKVREKDVDMPVSRTKETNYCAEMKERKRPVGCVAGVREEKTTKNIKLEGTLSPKSSDPPESHVLLDFLERIPVQLKTEKKTRGLQEEGEEEQGEEEREEEGEEEEEEENKHETQDVGETPDIHHEEVVDEEMLQNLESRRGNFYSEASESEKAELVVASRLGGCLLEQVLDGDVLQWCSVKLQSKKPVESVHCELQLRFFMKDELAAAAFGLSLALPLKIDISFDTDYSYNSAWSKSGDVCTVHAWQKTRWPKTQQPELGLSRLVPHLVRRHIDHARQKAPGWSRHRTSPPRFEDNLFVGLLRSLVHSLALLPFICPTCCRRHSYHASSMPRPCPDNLCQAQFALWKHVGPPFDASLQEATKIHLAPTPNQWDFQILRLEFALTAKYPSELDDATREKLRQEVRDLGVGGASQMDYSELIHAIALLRSTRNWQCEFGPG